MDRAIAYARLHATDDVLELAMDRLAVELGVEKKIELQCESVVKIMILY